MERKRRIANGETQTKQIRTDDCQSVGTQKRESEKISWCCSSPAFSLIRNAPDRSPGVLCVSPPSGSARAPDSDQVADEQSGKSTERRRVSIDDHKEI
jgi:hypothetical protein